MEKIDILGKSSPTDLTADAIAMSHTEPDRSGLVEIRVKGKTLKVPATLVNDRRVVATGGWLRIATVEDEDFVEGDAVKDPPSFIETLKRSALKADIFTFVQKLPETTPRYAYSFEWDNVAAIPTDTYEEWTKRVSRLVRQDVNRAKKRGVDVRLVEFTDQFVQGVVDIYNEIPVRQGRSFWHYGKSFEQVKTETRTYMERSEFLGAYCADELVGFMKVTYDGPLARMMQIGSKASHQDKRVSNALIAKAVERCESRRSTYLIYGKYVYRVNNSLTNFKRRNGFEEVRVPRYYIPLTIRGRLVLRFKMHHGFLAMLPDRVISVLTAARGRILRLTSSKPRSGHDGNEAKSGDDAG